MPRARYITWRRRWQIHRDLVIVAAHRAGLPQSMIADAFDMARSRIGQIIAEAKAKVGEQKTDAPTNRYPYRPLPVHRRARAK
jgi:hypothetical protein